jgi:hypothetical protein
MKRNLIAAALTALLFAGGCYSTTYVNKAVPVSPVKADQKLEQKMDFFWWGLAGTAEINIGQVCGGRSAARINTQHTFVNALLGVVTLGIYVPRTAFITCGEPGGQPT